jgi:RimJ/RimL family protein N-acetyltransferase
MGDVELLEGKTVNLRIVEKEDLSLLTEWFNKLEVSGEYNPLHQLSKTQAEKMFEGPHEKKPFIIEKKDGSKIGFITHFYVLHPASKLAFRLAVGAAHRFITHFYVLHPASRQLEIGYSLMPTERGKGYCTEATRLMVDYLFLSKDTMRIQAQTDPRNIASHKVLEKAGFKKEGTLRKSFFMRGELRDCYIYSILREEWKEPKILTKTS